MKMAMKSLRINFMRIKISCCALLIAGAVACSPENKKESSELPNVIIFYVDDLGYGDVGSYGAKGVATPHIDHLAEEGIRFTDGHCSAAMCTPSRYALLTGNYAFRNNAEILPGDAPLLIDTAQETLPKMLKRAGYQTAAIGKWHLGLGHGEIDWNQKVSPGANEIGFDYSFLIPATGDRVPTVFVENGRVVNLDLDDPIEVSYTERIDPNPIGLERPDLLRQKADSQHSETIVNGVSRIGFMKGGKKALWVDEDFSFVLNDKAKAFILNNKDKPFFLYYAFQDIHVPRMPNQNFVGKSEMGPRGDAIAQVDWVVGDIIKALEEQNLLENTLIIFTSDNGPVLDDGYADQAVELLGDHDPTGGFRGGKYSAYEAGTRVPTIVYWKGKIRHLESDALVSQIDLLASLADLTGQEVGESAIDSQNQLDVWMGESNKGREVLIEESFTLAIRQNNWKYIQPFKGNTPDWLLNKDIETGLSEEPQLFDLNKDSGEQENLAHKYPDKVSELDALISQIIDKAR